MGFTDLWRLTNVTLSVPLLIAMIYTTYKSWPHLKLVEDKLFILGTMIMLTGNALGSYTAWQLDFPFNAIGGAFFSIAGCWLTVSVALRIRHMRMANRILRKDHA